MFTVGQLIAHAVGDYVLQSDWMATEKTNKPLAALVHVILYTLPFLLITHSPLALAVILGTHFIIDHWRLARYVCWIKNFMAPPRTAGEVWWHPWAQCTSTGYHQKNKPVWMAVWLMIITDNLMHIIINGLAIHYL